MASRAAIEKRLVQEGIEFVLVQFVDITGAAKVKMVPSSNCADAGYPRSSFGAVCTTRLASTAQETILGQLVHLGQHQVAPGASGQLDGGRSSRCGQCSSARLMRSSSSVSHSELTLHSCSAVKFLALYTSVLPRLAPDRLASSRSAL